MDNFRGELRNAWHNLVCLCQTENLRGPFCHCATAREAGAGPACRIIHFSVSKTEMLRSCANLSKNGIALRMVWVLIRKLPSVTGILGLAAGQFWHALYWLRSPLM